MSPQLQELANAAKRAVARGLITHGPKQIEAVAPAGKRLPRRWPPACPVKRKEAEAKALEMIRAGSEYVSIIQKLGIPADSITALKRANGIPVRGDERDGKAFRGFGPNGKERWVAVNMDQK